MIGIRTMGLPNGASCVFERAGVLPFLRSRGDTAGAVSGHRLHRAGENGPKPGFGPEGRNRRRGRKRGKFTLDS